MKRARLIHRESLTPGCPEKETQHLILETDLEYEVGDCAVILPTNDPDEVDAILQNISSPTEEISDFLTHSANLSRYKSGMDPKKLPPLLPRYYSIASSKKEVGNQIHLTVRQLDQGLCTRYLCKRVPLGTEIPVRIHKATTFKLAEDTTPIIMIGPGTGVAPYRGFLQERHIRNALGKNWLFFGEWTRKNHFLYEPFWQDLTNLRLTLAFSRDQPEKIYVQHRIWEARKELWQWLQEGATLYVCGDAKQMARAVDKTLCQIAITEGGLTEQKAKTYFRSLRKQHRYLRDIY